MHNSSNLGHPTNYKPIGQISDISSGLINTRLSDISGEITGILDEELQCIVRDNNELFNSLLEQLRIEIEIIGKRLGYDYQSQYNYSYNLLQPNSTKLKVLVSLLKDNIELSKIYFQILGLFDNVNLQSLIKDKLFSDYLENLVIENIPQDNLIDYKTYSLLEEIIKGKDFAGFNSGFLDEHNINGCSAISLHGIVLRRYFEDSKHDITNFSRNVGFCKYLGLTDTHLEELSLEELELISAHFYNLKILSLSPDEISKMSQEQLFIIFRNLTNIKYLEIVAGSLNNPIVLEKFLSILSRIKTVNTGKIICKFGFGFNNFSQDCKDVMNKYTAYFDFK